MLILTIRSDKPEAELALYEGSQQLAYATWNAHRELAETIHLNIASLLASKKKSITDVQGIAIYKGPGSFTGLRIGISVANAFAASLGIPIVSETGDTWLEKAIKNIQQGQDEHLTQPLYGAPVHITLPRK